MQYAVRFRWFDALALVAAASLSVIASLALTLTPKEGSEGLAVVFAPWTDAATVVSRATESGGRFIRFGALDFIAVIEPVRQGYAENVRANGAWFLADPVALAACLRPLSRSKT